MAELDDYVLFAGVVEHGGFAQAGRAMRMQKSKLSRRIAALENRLGVRLIERSTRRFRVTDIDYPRNVVQPPRVFIPAQRRPLQKIVRK